jgi:sporulation protein YlmC with PRC-barrel domain
LSDAYQPQEDYHVFQDRYRPCLDSSAEWISVRTKHDVQSDTPAATSAAKDGWRASKLAGVDVYNEQNEKIGDISDVDKSGKASAVIIGVGGFLGMGEHLVLVPFDKVKWVNEPVHSTTAATTSDRPAATNSDTPRSESFAHDEGNGDHHHHDPRIE